MGDTRLLELAGRAAGENYGPDNNPLDRDDLALRLAVKLHIDVLLRSPKLAQAFGGANSYGEQARGDDPCAAARRAIVRAAAALQETQNG